MREHLYILRGWFRSFVSWICESQTPSYRSRKERKQRALRAAQKVLR